MTSKSTFPRRFTKIDDLTRPDHYYLTAEPGGGRKAVEKKIPKSPG